MNMMMNLLAKAFDSALGPVQTEDIMKSLELMGKGMLGIFVVILLIIGVVSVLTRLSQPRADSDSAPD